MIFDLHCKKHNLKRPCPMCELEKANQPKILPLLAELRVKIEAAEANLEESKKLLEKLIEKNRG